MGTNVEKAFVNILVAHWEMQDRIRRINISLHANVECFDESLENILHAVFDLYELPPDNVYCRDDLFEAYAKDMKVGLKQEALAFLQWLESAKKRRN